MLKHFGWLILAAGSLFGTTGCACWNHMWGSWAYYGDCNTYGYCDNCPAGPCSGGCDDCCNGLGVYPPPGGYCGMYDNCGSDCCESGCCPNHCGPRHGCWLVKLFHWHDWCCDPCGYPHGGCGEKYCCDWINHPPTCDPCDCHGNFTGNRDPRPCYQASPRYGSVWSGGYNSGNQGYGEGEMVEGEMAEEVAPPSNQPRRASPPPNGRATPPAEPVPGPAAQPGNPTFQPQHLPSVRRNTLPSVQRRPANSFPIR